MAIDFGPSDLDTPLMFKINTTPLVDVMLVLLIIFLITIPAVNASVPLTLPKESNQSRDPKPGNIVLSVDATGQVYWFDRKLGTGAELQTRLADTARLQPQPEIQLHGDAKASFHAIGRVLNAIQAAGIEKVAFITETPPK